MQGIKPQRLTNKELLDYAHLFGYDKLTPEWTQEMARRLDRFENGEEETQESILNDEYRRGYDDGYDSGYNDASDEITAD